jgi:Lar family restriction alleviation protein
MNEELKPCPFCGSPAYIAEKPDDSKFNIYAICTACEAETACYGSDQLATEAWNTRAESKPLTETEIDKIYARFIKTGMGSVDFQDAIHSALPSETDKDRRISELTASLGIADTQHGYAQEKIDQLTTAYKAMREALVYIRGQQEFSDDGDLLYTLDDAQHFCGKTLTQYPEIK